MNIVGLVRVAIDMMIKPLPEDAEMSWPSYGLSLLSFIGASVVVAALCGALQLPPRIAILGKGFCSAASALCVLIALHRALERRLRGLEVSTAGNFWVDLVRGALGFLLPLALLVALYLNRA